MSCLRVAALAAGLALAASPCLAFTFSSAPVDRSGRSMMADPDANLESTTSAMQDAYIQNNGGGATNGVALLRNAPGDSAGPAANFGAAGINGVAVIDAEPSVATGPVAPPSSNGAGH